MAPINDGAFAAVDAFFGVDSSKAVSVTATASNERVSETVRGRRLGVGATKLGSAIITHDSSKTVNHVGNSKKRILQVGSKKRSRKVGYGDEEEEDDGDSSSGTADSDSEEDEGRTAIDSGGPKTNKNKSDLSKTNTVVASSSTEMIGKPQQKKNLGKKERQRLAKDQLEKESSVPVETTTTNSAASNDNTTKERQDGADTNTQKLKRRKKVRSRQKNIRKDNRDVKPEHLVPGSRNYKGLPLTPETRAKLNLPVMAKSPFASDRQWDQGNWDDGGANNEDIGYAGDITQGDSLDAMPLAVDRPNVLDEGQPASKKGKTTKTGKAKRYKNLM